jgi:alanyl-tRNA synthetase
MNSKEIRSTFLEFFESKLHKIVPSAPIVNKNDPTLMFTNAGMNQFKDLFLGNKTIQYHRVADTQKCLRVSGKHNDLEDVGIDGYHHTMFEMLGNWSFGDPGNPTAGYFKEEAIAWAWELITEVYKVDKSRIYVSVFGGDEAEGLEADEEAADLWKKWIAPDRVLYFNKKDNFWEMGDTGPCGPCSEIHVDLRPDSERALKDGAALVNADDPNVIEIWNLVFIQFNRKADGKLVELPAKHVDTGMGFERLCRVVQGVASNYDSDLFKPYFDYISETTGKKYTGSYDPSNKNDIAFRVVIDHIRAVTFCIADGQLPSNNGAGYVIRRILRRAARYYFSFLDYKEPLLCQLIPIIGESFGDIFPEVKAQLGLIENVIREEEKSFLRTLDSGLKRMDQLDPADKNLEGQLVFELYDTFGFPVDLTRLIATEKGWTIDEAGFNAALQIQKERSRADAQKSYGDWMIVREGSDVQFIGYDQLLADNSYVLRTRTLQQKGKESYQIVLDVTPFYPEGGGQVGDTGYLEIAGERINVINTVKENDLVLHFVDKLPETLDAPVKAYVDSSRRSFIEYNHSATHLMHAALRQVLGTHVQQKGSLVNESYLRFDFSHFQKVESADLRKIENIVNEAIRRDIPRREARNLPVEQAKAAGAMMLFGEKYGEEVRMITFDPEFSIELCGGCHVNSTGQIGYFKIISEGAIAAGVRRIEAITALEAEQWVQTQLNQLDELKEALKSTGDPVKAVLKLQEDVKLHKKQVEELMIAQVASLQHELKHEFVMHYDIAVLGKVLPFGDHKSIKNLAHQLSQNHSSHAIVFGWIDSDKPQLVVQVSESLAKEGVHAGNIVKESAKVMNGGGGGQPFYATAGGSDTSKLEETVKHALSLIEKSIQSLSTTDK